MSRSHKKHPFSNWVCYFSNKKDKRIANRLMRSANKQILKKSMSFNKVSEPNDGLDDDLDMIYPIEELDNSSFKKLREVSNTWCFASDGLAQYWSPSIFSKEEINKIMRK